MMDNHGQIYATDPDGRRLAPIFARLERSGARNVQVRAPRGASDVLADLVGRCDLVARSMRPAAARAPGGATPTRNGGCGRARWSNASRTRRKSLDNAARFVKPGGRLVYVTCSLLKAENEDRVAAFLEAHADFLPLDAAHWARACGLDGAGLPCLEARRRNSPQPLAHRDGRVLCRRVGPDAMKAAGIGDTMTVLIDLVGGDPRAARPRHPEKAHRPDQPSRASPPGSGSRRPARAGFAANRRDRARAQARHRLRRGRAAPISANAGSRSTPPS